MTRSRIPTSRPQPAPSRRWRAVALPAQHGSWGLVLEPIWLGLLVGGVWPGIWLALAAFAGFLLDQPLRLLWVDRRRGREFARTRLARRLALGYGLLLAAAGFLFLYQGGWRSLWPLVVALPLFAVYVWYDWNRPGRHWQAELAAPLAFGAVATSLALAGDRPVSLALALWIALGARSLPAILFVRARLRLDRGQPAGWGQRSGGPLAAHVAALLVIVALAAVEWLPWTSLLPFVLLLARAAVGLSPWRRPVSVPRLGVAEMGWGALVVFGVAAAIQFA